MPGIVPLRDNRGAGADVSAMLLGLALNARVFAVRAPGLLRLVPPAHTGYLRVTAAAPKANDADAAGDLRSAAEAEPVLGGSELTGDHSPYVFAVDPTKIPSGRMCVALVLVSQTDSAACTDDPSRRATAAERRAEALAAAPCVVCVEVTLNEAMAGCVADLPAVSEPAPALTGGVGLQLRAAALLRPLGVFPGHAALRLFFNAAPVRVYARRLVPITAQVGSA